MKQKIAVEPLSRKNIRSITWELRKQFGLQNKLYFPVLQFIEWVLPEFGMDSEIVSYEEMGNAYGVTHTRRGIMSIREDVYIRAVQGHARDRFTLCHELGHFLLHTPDRVSFARGNVPAYMDPEWQANAFAGELMAPYYLVKNMTAFDISDKCGMSLMAAEIQYNEYHKVV